MVLKITSLRPSVVITAKPGFGPCSVQITQRANAGMDALRKLPLEILVQNSDIITWFNGIYRVGDYASMSSAYTEGLTLVPDRAGMLAYQSWADAQAAYPGIGVAVDYILYNPEHGDGTPPEEKADLVGTCAAAYAWLHARSLKLWLVPDRLFVDQLLPDLVPVADVIMLQGQQLQQSPTDYAAWMLAKIEIARAVNPDITIFCQIGALRFAELATKEEMLRAILTVATECNGVGIFSQPISFSVLRDFVEMIRPS